MNWKIVIHTELVFVSVINRANLLLSESFAENYRIIKNIYFNPID